MLIFDKTPTTNKEVKNTTLRNTTLTKQTALKKQPPKTTTFTKGDRS